MGDIGSSPIKGLGLEWKYFEYRGKFHKLIRLNKHGGVVIDMTQRKISACGLNHIWTTYHNKYNLGEGKIKEVNRRVFDLAKSNAMELIFNP